MTTPPVELTTRERSEIGHDWALGPIALVSVVERIVAARMADAGDEAYRLDWTGGMSWNNPYRAEESR